MFHFCDCFTLFVLISFGLDEIMVHGANNGLHSVNLKTETKSNEMSNNGDPMGSTYPHFESKSILPSNNPEHEKVCWKKCRNKNLKNMREILLRKQNESLQRSTESNNTQARTRKSCADSECKSEMRGDQPFQEFESSKSNYEPTKFTNIFMSKSSREPGKISIFQYLFSRGLKL